LKELFLIKNIKFSAQRENSEFPIDPLLQSRNSHKNFGINISADKSPHIPRFTKRNDSHPYSLNPIESQSLNISRSQSYSFNAVSREKLNTLSMANQMDVPGVNRYNPNFKALKPNPVGIIIKPLTKGSNMFKISKKKRQNLMKRL